MGNWSDCKNLLCIRLDNMGDLLMSAPAMASLKKSFNCKITVLTSSMGAPIAPFIPSIDDVIIFDSPWVKSNASISPDVFTEIVEVIKQRKFDGAIIFTVFSQNPFGAAFLAWLSNIPKRAAYSRENLYDLLTDWLPDPEPFTTIQHQVRRDLALAKHIGAESLETNIKINPNAKGINDPRQKLSELGCNLAKPWLILHPGVSESKRECPAELWIETGKQIIGKSGYQVFITGSDQDRVLAERIAVEIGRGAFALAGKLSLSEFIFLIKRAPLLVSVNTVAIHIASATETKVIVLYALTNPQHTPWQSIGKIFPYSVPESMQSKNKTLEFIQGSYFSKRIDLPSANEIVLAAQDLLSGKSADVVTELVGIEGAVQGKSGERNFIAP